MSQLKKWNRKQTLLNEKFVMSFVGAVRGGRIADEYSIEGPVLGYCQSCDRKSYLAGPTKNLPIAEATRRVFSPEPSGVYVGAICDSCYRELRKSEETFFATSDEAKVHAKSHGWVAMVS